MRKSLIVLILLIAAVYPIFSIAKDSKTINQPIESIGIKSIDVKAIDAKSDPIVSNFGPSSLIQPNAINVAFACIVPMPKHFRIFFGYASKLHQIASLRLEDNTLLTPYQTVLPRYTDSKAFATGEFYITLVEVGYTKVVEITLTNDAGKPTLFKFHTADFQSCK